tara:strand:- start:1050 stop:1766 length:717 start_codon:yes stop_codon:yes gene_type:complete
LRVKKILKDNKHRPWSLPNKKWSFYQEWNNAIFLHWEVDLKELSRFVPNNLQIDLHNGKPWVSVVAFTMEKIRPRNLPYFSPVSNFHEINIRTYVKSNNKTGVYFLSIEAEKLISCKIARKISKLPYRYSKINRSNNSFSSFNPVFKDSLHIDYSSKELKNNFTPLDIFLTERYALFHNVGDYINEFEIHHLPWPIQNIDLFKLEVNYSRFTQLIGDMPDKTHFSNGVKVISWNSNKY